MTNRDESKSLPAQILEILAEGKFTARHLADRLGVQSRAEVKQVRDALLALRLDGRVSAKETENGGAKLWGLADRRPDIQGKIWRAACLKSQKGHLFSAGDLAKLAECSRDYVKRYAGFLCANHYLVPIGRRGNVIVFQVPVSKVLATPPHWNRRAEQRKGLETGDRGPEQAKPILNCDQTECADCGMGPIVPDLAEALAGVGKFIAEVRQIIGEANVKVTATINGIETTLAKLTGESHEPEDRG